MYAIRSILRSNAVSVHSVQIRSKSAYQRGVHFLFKKNLLVTNSLTSGLFMGLGDLMQQEIEFQYKIIPERYNWDRIWRMFKVGCLLGPLHHYYYEYLDKLLPGASMKVVTQKILADQFFASPATILCFFYSMGYLEGKTLNQSTTEIKNKFAFVYMGDWLFWPPTQFINFYFLPTQYRVVYINFVTMIFNIFLSYTKHYDQH